MHCINTSHPDYKTLLVESGLHPDVLKAKISIWMTKNSDDRFPSIEELLGKDIMYQNENPRQAKNRILKAVFANTAGYINTQSYIPTMQLINTYNTKMGSQLLQLKKAASGSYYIVVNSLGFQKTSSVEEEANQELEDKLKEWAMLHDISIEAIDDLIKRFEGRYSSGILGVADFANQLIGLADERSIDTLPEEVAHFAIRILKNKDDISVNRALDNVIYTDEYLEVKEEYKNDYSLEEQFREEALGKILAKEIVGQFKDDTIVNNQPFGLYVKAIKEKFIKWVKNLFNKESRARTQIEKTINPLAQSILNKEKIVNIKEDTTGDIFLQKEDEVEDEIEEVEDIIVKQKREFLENTIKILTERINMLSTSAKSTTTISILEREIALIENNIAKGELDLSIAGFVKLAKGELGQINDVLDNALEKGIKNPGTLVISDNFIKMYSDLFITLSNEMYEWNVPKEEREDLEKLIRGIETTIAIISPKLNALQRKETIKTLDEGNIDSYGNKIDEDFDSREVFEATKEDTSIWRLQVGNYKYADSKIIKIAHKIIFDSIQRVKRFAVGTANDLLLAQDKMFKEGGKIEDLIEKDNEGKLTHFFIREYYWDKYYQALNTAKQKMAEELGFKNYKEITKEFLTDEQKKVFNKAWKRFFSEHTIQTVSSDGVKLTRPNNTYKNPNYATMIKNPATKAYYDLIIQKKKEAVNKLPVKYRTEKLIYMVPPILKSTVHRLSNKNESWNKRIGNLVKESLLLDKDDTQFGQVNVLNNKMVPIHFTSVLDNINDVSFDVANTVTMFSEMAENFKEMNKIAGQLGVVQLQLAKRSYQKGKNIKSGLESNDYKALDTLMTMHVFGAERNALTSKLPDNALTQKLGIAGKDFSATKASQLLSRFIRTNNLALNVVTSTAGWLKGSGDSIIEDQIGIYTTNESKNWARIEFSKNLTEVIGNIGNAKQTNKMHLILQNANIVELEKILYNTTDNRLSRKLLNRDILYTTFATGDYGIKGRITLAIYDNYRLYNNKFLTRSKFLELQEKKGISKNEAQKKWEGLREKSLYNIYEVVDGKLQVKKEFENVVTEGVLNSATGKVDQVTRYVDGTLSPTDKGALSRTILGDFLLMHRGWFINLIDTRLKKETSNMITEEEEIGTYRASASFIWNDFGKTLITEKGNLMAAFATWNTLSPARKRGVLKTTYDLIFLNIIAFLAAITNLAADESDDEDWTIQYAAYQMNRLLLEQNSAWSIGDLIQMIDEPVVGARMIKDLVDITEMWNPEVYERGMYAGKTHATKWWMKKMPTRNLYELQYPQLKNNFIKKMVESKYYEWMSPEQINSINATQKLNNYFSDGQLSEPVDLQDTINQLQSEEEEYNGFN